MKATLEEYKKKGAYVKVTLAGKLHSTFSNDVYAGFLVDYDDLGITISLSQKKAEKRVSFPYSNIVSISLWGDNL